MSIENSVNTSGGQDTARLEQAAKVASKTVDRTPASSEKPAVSAKFAAVEAIEQSARLEKVEDVSVEVAEKSFSVDRIREMIRELEEALPAASNSLSFRVDEVLDRPVITVVDQKSGEIVRTLPSDEVLRVAHNIEKMRGILFDKPA